MYVGTHSAVVVDTCAGIENGVLADHAAGLDDATSHYLDAIGQGDIRGYPGSRMNQWRETETSFLRPSVNALTQATADQLTDTVDKSGAGRIDLGQGFIAAEHWDAVPVGFSPGGQVRIAQTNDCVTGRFGEC